MQCVSGVQRQREKDSPAILESYANKKTDGPTIYPNGWKTPSSKEYKVVREAL
jgi:hypothetical protein